MQLQDQDHALAVQPVPIPVQAQVLVRLVQQAHTVLRQDVLHAQLAQQEAMRAPQD
jgi:hypothetical protein